LPLAPVDLPVTLPRLPHDVPRPGSRTRVYTGANRPSGGEAALNATMEAR
jgi:hypothetical protein